MASAAYEAKNRDYLQGQIGNPEGPDSPNKKYYDPRVWLGAGEAVPHQAPDRFLRRPQLHESQRLTASRSRSIATRLDSEPTAIFARSAGHGHRGGPNGKVIPSPMIDNIVSLLGDKADYLLKHNCQTIPTKLLHLPGPDWVDRIFAPTNRNQRVLNNLQRIYNTGRLAGTGYLSILPVDQGIEHSAGASFAKNPLYFDPENIVKLAVEGGCNAVASTFGVLGAVARKYAHKIPFLVKINHNELLTYPNQHKEILSAR